MTAATPYPNPGTHACSSCGGPVAAHSTGTRSTQGPSGPVYSVGQLSPQFPSPGVEKEFAQLAGGASSPGTVDIKLLREVLSAPENLYLGRHLCWLFTAQGADSFIILPRDDAEVVRLMESMPSDDTEEVVHTVVGKTVRADRIDSPCIDLGLPAVVADQLLAFTLNEFTQALLGAGARNNGGQAPSPEPPTTNSVGVVDGDKSAEDMQRVARHVFHQLTRRTDNRGLADEHRALNYLALRYPQIYRAVSEAYRDNKVLVGIQTRHSHSQTRRLVTVAVTFRHRHTDITERYQCLVDVTEVFPFLVTSLQPTFE
jgi:PatG C-terminal